MKAFVTGGTGFIGSHLVDHLINSSKYDEIKCLVRTDEKWLKNKNYTRIPGDLHSITGISKALADVDTIFHLAGVVKAPTQHQFNLANVDATENMIRLAEKAGINNVIILSSLSAAGPSNGKPKSESDSMQPVSMYGKSKKMMEEIIHRTATGQMSIKILRPPAVYGPREDQIYTLFKMMNYGITPVVGNGNTPRLSLVYVGDVIRGIDKAADYTTPGVHTYFISGQITCWNEIKDIAGTVLGKNSLSINIKPTFVKKIAGLIETSASLFGTYPVINREKAREMIMEWTCTSEKAATDLDYIPKYSLEEGISRTLNWYKKNQWL